MNIINRIKKQPIITSLMIFAILFIVIGIIMSIIYIVQDIVKKTKIENSNNDIINYYDGMLMIYTGDENKEISIEELQDIPYYIKVNYSENVVTIYKKDSSGEYTKPYKAMICSVGTDTPTEGIYTIPGEKLDRQPWGLMVGNVYAQYYVRIVDGILFHSVPYYRQDKSTLEYAEYDKLGTKASAGCVRLTVEDALWIYNNCMPGTQVEFYMSTEPGPLGKPVAQKISSNVNERGWDPTDPDMKNPWKIGDVNLNTDIKEINNIVNKKEETSKNDEKEILEKTPIPTSTSTPVISKTPNTVPTPIISNVPTPIVSSVIEIVPTPIIQENTDVIEDENDNNKNELERNEI